MRAQVVSACKRSSSLGSKLRGGAGACATAARSSAPRGEKSIVAGSAASLAPCPPVGLARLHACTTQGEVNVCPSLRALGEGVRGQAASGSRAKGSCEAHVEKGRAGFETSAPRLERMPERMESRPKAPWCEGHRLRRMPPHHGAASSSHGYCSILRCRRAAHGRSPARHHDLRRSQTRALRHELW